MPSFVELGVEDIASFCFYNLSSLHGSNSSVQQRDVYMYGKYMRSLATLCGCFRG